jgi:hypothetical protein
MIKRSSGNHIAGSTHPRVEIGLIIEDKGENRKRMRGAGMLWIVKDFDQFIPICNETFGFISN